MRFLFSSLTILCWLWMMTLPVAVEAQDEWIVDPEKTGTCWNYLRQPCNCGTCSWFYQLEPVCQNQNLSSCVRGGYFEGGPREEDCCKANIVKMIIITAVVTAIVACWCCLIAAIIKIKQMQRRKRQRVALDDMNNDILMTPGGDISTLPRGRYTGDPEYNLDAGSDNGYDNDFYAPPVNTIRNVSSYDDPRATMAAPTVVPERPTKAAPEDSDGEDRI